MRNTTSTVFNRKLELNAPLVSVSQIPSETSIKGIRMRYTDFLTLAFSDSKGTVHKN